MMDRLVSKSSQNAGILSAVISDHKIDLSDEPVDLRSKDHVCGENWDAHEKHCFSVLLKFCLSCIRTTDMSNLWAKWYDRLITGHSIRTRLLKN